MHGGICEAGYDIIMHSSQAAQEVGITSISGQEYVLQYDGVLLVGTKQFFGGNYQDAIDACVEEGGFAIMCHPNQNPDLPSGASAYPSPTSSWKISKTRPASKFSTAACRAGPGRALALATAPAWIFGTGC